MKHEDGVVALVVAAIAIPATIALAFLWFSGLDLKSQVTLTLAIVLGSGGFAAAARARVMRPLQTLANLTSALRERDYAVRGRHGRRDDAFGLALTELSGLAEQLRGDRWRDEEAAAGLQRVVEGLDAVVLAVDETHTIRLANRTAERLLGRALVGTTLADVGLADLAGAGAPRTFELARTTWEVRPSDVRLAGMPHRLYVMTDVQHALRAEERLAWQRLVRVLGHEINNSLGPIASIAETLRTGLASGRELGDDLPRGLEVIERRAAALSRFMHSYARLVRLPPPRPGRVDVAAWIARTVALETRASVEVAGGPEVAIDGDADQLDQLLINLVRNAIDASPTGARIAWSLAAGALVVTVEDEGPGVDSANLFVPFFTTKPSGSGIGLVLARQIAEAHRGTLTVRNRKGARGAEAVITLPARTAADRVASGA
jgi:nitrogen fixation/metabolism regulation signal transduction histidine kinase